MSAGTTYNQIEGVLGSFDNLLPGDIYSIIIIGLGRSSYSNRSTYRERGQGCQNWFDGDELILWGQNTAAYDCYARR